MDSLMPLMKLLACVLLVATACCEPLGAAVQRRSDAYGVYADQFARGYEPIAFAALSLHAPIPVLHVLSRVPLRPQPPAHDAHPAASTLKPLYAHPYMYAASMNHFAQEPAEAEEPTVLYARPNPRGGFTYRRRPSRRRPPRPERPEREPILIRVHKYRVIRDR